MSKYQVLARKYRPQTFKEVLGQNAIVTTLKNAIKNKRLAHAYLFCGSRGTGKTTLARIFAKALNCQNPTEEHEPCGICSSCKDIASGNSLDVLEIDGASHRGIDDVRQINETVGYASSSGKYKIYIIDEVHMLTKEAFNALLKTLEEPPARVIFFFATTEPHKVLPTILSRCQRFNLNRIPSSEICSKLQRIAKEQGVEVEEEALQMLAKQADGGLRDAESLFDQILAFHQGTITVDIVSDVLGVMPRETYFQLDHAGKEGRLGAAFEIAHEVFSQGKDVSHFIDGLTDHIRTLLLVKLCGENAPFLTLSETDRKRYAASAGLYTQEQCLTILEYLIEMQSQMKYQLSEKITLETVLLHIMRSHQRIPVEYLVKRLMELEQSAASTTPSPTPPLTAPRPTPTPPSLGTTSVDPTPTPQDLGIKQIPTQRPKETKILPKDPPLPPKAPPVQPSTKTTEQVPTTPLPPREVSKEAPSMTLDPKERNRYDTLLQFAAVELEGTVKKIH